MQASVIQTDRAALRQAKEEGARERAPESRTIHLEEKMATYFGENAFKLGLFGINCSGGCTLSAAPDRWTAEWDDIVAVAQMGDEAGIEFILPIARWRGLGESFVWERSFETFTQAAALGALTKRIGIFVTAHVPLITPVVAAKAIATIDHVTKGRAGLNIVCGWNADEFAMHGVVMDGDRRYEQGLDWYKIFTRLIEGGPDFDWDSEFYRLRHLTSNPLPVQARPPVMSAGSSGPGQEFAAAAADIMFTSMHSYGQTQDTITRLKALSSAYRRNPDIYVQSLFVVRPTRKEAEEFYYEFAEKHADEEALAYFKRQKSATLAHRTLEGGTAADLAIVASMRQTGQTYPGQFPGMHLLLGTPDDVVAEMQRMQSIGLAGCAAVFQNYLRELPYFNAEVLPRMERVGLRGRRQG